MRSQAGDVQTMSMQDRQIYHLGQAQTALGLASDREGGIEAMHRVEAALHELGATFAESNRSDMESAALREEQDAALRVLRDVVDRHQAAIEKANQGLAPWGEIKAVGEQLQAAIQRAQNCLL